MYGQIKNIYLLSSLMLEWYAQAKERNQLDRHHPIVLSIINKYSVKFLSTSTVHLCTTCTRDSQMMNACKLCVKEQICTNTKTEKGNTNQHVVKVIISVWNG